MDKGAHFYRCDFQVHTPRDRQWKGSACVTDEERNDYAATFIQACREKHLDAVAITDHHDLAFVKYIREAARTEHDDDGKPVPYEKQIKVFPGIELTLNVPCQALLIFDADFPEDLFSLALTALAITTNAKSDPNTVETRQLDNITTLVKLRDELDKHEYLKGRYIILPNVSEGGSATLLRRGNAPKYKNMPCVGGYLDGSIERLGTGNLDIVNGRAREYGNKKIALFQTSDSRRDDHAELGKHATWVKWATPTAEALRQGCLAQKSRISQNVPVLPETVITSISVSNSAFLGPIDLELNQQYTALIGGRGTGKSTVLEYLRWALCDQQPDPTVDDELPNYQARRKLLIDHTLKKLKATVQVRFVVNGILHIVRRNSDTKEILLKIGDGDLTPCKEADIRSLLPIQAYSQKQLSNVGIRVDELTRFIHAQIKNDLDDIDKRITSISTEIRQLYATIQRKRTIDKGIEKEKLTVESLSKQAALIRESLSGISEDDRKRISQQPAYEEAQIAVDTWDTDIERVKDAIDEFHLVVNELPTPAQRDIADLPGADVLSGIHGEIQNIVKDIQASITEMDQRIQKVKSSDGSFVGEYKKERDKWVTKYDNFQKEYKAAKQKSTAHESRLKELTDVEKRVSELQIKITKALKEEASLGKPEVKYAKLRKEWQRLHNDRATLMEKECENLTTLSGEEIRATIQRGAGVAILIEKLKSAVTGSGTRKEKLEAIAKSVATAETPVAQWDDFVQELQLLAQYEATEESSDAVPATPTLSACGLTSNDLRKVASRLTNEAWLELALTQLEDNPVFEYKTREKEYIPFINASAGQQATALLKALLNQPGPPLIIDQPEDDLDNPVIFSIVEQIWKAKKCRQLIFASHNANLVVNGDAELVAWCDYRAAGDHSGGKVAGEGAIDIVEIRDAIKQVMEGGEAAFKLRSDKYGF